MLKFLFVFLATGLVSRAEILFSPWSYTNENGEAIIFRNIGVGELTRFVTIPTTIGGLPVTEIAGPWSAPWESLSPITGLLIPEGVRVIRNNALSGLSITNVILPESLTSIGEAAFQNCLSLTNVTIPSNVTNIGQGAFGNCLSLNSIYVSSNNSFFSEDDGVLYNKNKNLLIRFPQAKNGASFSIPTSVTLIAPEAFSGCTNLTSVVIPGSVVSIKQGAFQGCTSLTNVTIENGVRRIENGAFSGCTNLTSLIFPDSVTFLGSLAYMGSTSVTNLTLPVQLLPYVSNLGVNEEIIGASFLNSLVNSLATNQAFISNLAQAILAASNNYGLATKTGVSNTITTLATKTELSNSLTQSRTDGINSVISNPNLWTLYTTNQIKAMVMGDLMLTRTNNGQFVLNYDIEQSDDLSNWAPYAGYALPLTNLPTDKAFVRIKLKNQQ